MPRRALALAAAVAAALIVSAPLSAATAPFAYDIPAGCRIVHADADRVDLACGNVSRASVIYRRGGSDRAALQRLVDQVVAGWTNLRLISNREDGSLDHRPARTILAGGDGAQCGICNVQILAAPANGGWYAVTFSSPPLDFHPEARRYYAPLVAGLRIR